MNNSGYALFPSSMKMADMILKNYSLLSVLPRFGVHLGFGDKSIGEVCAKYNIDEHFFLLACNVHTFDDYLPEKDEIVKLNIESLIDYLQQSHNYYIKEKITAIEQKIDEIGKGCSKTHAQILKQFFAEYKQEVINHFDYEEEVVFPYIRRLAKGETQVNYHIDQYEENHSNIEDKLGDLKNIMIKYLPEEVSSETRNSILFDIFLFEEELSKHTRIENKILIPFVSEIEKEYEQ
ncbi:hemerythrin domain-containing protein [Porphyromonadaceae bacterium]